MSVSQAGYLVPDASNIEAWRDPVRRPPLDQGA